MPKNTTYTQVIISSNNIKTYLNLVTPAKNLSKLSLLLNGEQQGVLQASTITAFKASSEEVTYIIDFSIGTSSKGSASLTVLAKPAIVDFIFKV